MPTFDLAKPVPFVYTNGSDDRGSSLKASSRERTFGESPSGIQAFPPQEHTGDEPAGRARYSADE
ncbi:MAG TPA: hypothetical protein PK537_08080 [Candidatus Limiplasma sp.]|nr:hypothetical protein [Candidatus Limiplasma sp.]